MEQPIPKEAASYPVKHGDVIPFARVSCKWCLGKGEFVFRATQREKIKRKVEGGEIEVDGRGIPLRAGDGTGRRIGDRLAQAPEGSGMRVCKCALNRFVKANAGKVGTVGKEMFWIAGCEPEDCQARKDLKAIVAAAEANPKPTEAAKKMEAEEIAAGNVLP